MKLSSQGDVLFPTKEEIETCVHCHCGPVRIEKEG